MGVIPRSPGARRASIVAAVLIAAFSVYFSYDIVTGRRFLSQPDLSDYYFPYRQWLVGELKRGHFPLWNPYWGLGQPTEWFLAIPLDLYTIVEILWGPAYQVLYLLQLLVVLVAVFYAARMIGCAPIPASVTALVFFLLPNVTHWYFYFLLVPPYIANALCFVLVSRYLRHGNLMSLAYIFWAISLSMLGTKAEFWFQNAVLYIFYVACAAASCWRARPFSVLIRQSLLACVPLLLAVLSQAWQINMTWRFLMLSGRTTPPVAAFDLVRILSDSVAGSRLLPVLLICGAAWLLTGSARPKWLPALVLSVLYCLNLTVAAPNVVIAAWRLLEGLGELLASFARSPVAIGALLGLLLSVLLGRTLSWRRELQTFACFIVFIYYWCRPGPGDAYGEMAVIRTAPAFLSAALSGLVWLGCRHVGRDYWATLSFLAAVFVLLMRDQGQVLLSYIAGVVWVPQRDSYLADFPWAVLGGIGLNRAERRVREMYLLFRGGQLSRKWRGLVSPLSAITLFALVLSLRPDPYFAHWMMDKSPPDYPYYAGVPDIRRALRQLRESDTTRIFIVNKPTKSQTFGYGEALLERVGQVTLYSSSVPKNYRDWTFYQRTGLVPGDWVGYNSAFTPQMLAKLPHHKEVGLRNDLLYFYTVIARPALARDLLRLMGVSYVVMFKQSLDDPTVDFFDLGNHAELETKMAGLRLEDVREMPAGYYVPNANPGQTFVRETMIVGRLVGSLGRAFTVHAVSEARFGEFSGELNPKVASASIRTASFEFPIESVAIERYEPERVTVRARGAGDTYLVITDLYHPFWHATVDGQRAEIVPAFSVFRGIKLPPGLHTVELVYRLPRLYESIALSVISALLACVMHVYLGKRRGSPGPVHLRRERDHTGKR